MPFRKLLIVLFWAIPMSVFAKGEISIGIVKNRIEANIEVTISDIYLGFGDTVFVTDSYPGFGKTFYITDNRSTADIALLSPPKDDEPKSADARLYVHKIYPGFGDAVYVANRYPGFGKTVYFTKSYPGFGKSLYIEDPLLKFNQKVLAVLLLKLNKL
jgi:hypothetical protein